MVAGGRGWQFCLGSFWGLQMGPNPTDRAKLSSKRHLIRDGRGIPLAVQMTGANRNDSQQALAQKAPSIASPIRPPRAEKVYTHLSCFDERRIFRADTFQTFIAEELLFFGARQQA